MKGPVKSYTKSYELFENHSLETFEVEAGFPSLFILLSVKIY